MSLSPSVVLAFPCLDFVGVLEKEVDVIEPVHQTVFLVTVDFKVLALTSGEVGDPLVGQVHLHFHLWIVMDALEKFGEEGFRHHDWQHEIVEFVVLVDVGEKGTDDDSEPISCNDPSRMIPR